MLDSLKEVEPELRKAYREGLLKDEPLPVREAIQQSLSAYSRQAVFDRNASYGNDLVYVRTNATARPKCYPYQGKVISQTGNGRTVRDLHGNSIQAISIDETTYGQPDGLWGINCHHVPPMVFISV